MDFEKQLRDELLRQAENKQPTKELQTRVLASFKQYQQTQQTKRKGKSFMKKRLIAGFVAAVVLVPTGVFAGPTLVNKIIGSPEDAKNKYGLVEQEYNDSNELLEVAKKLFTKEEFEKFTTLWKEDAELNKKAIVVNGQRTSRGTYRLSKEELKRYTEVGKELAPYMEKIFKQFEYSLDGAQRLVNYPINHPTYIPKGYKLDGEGARADVTTGKPMPIISMTYKKNNADESKAMAYWMFTIQIQENLKEKLTPYENNIFAFERHDTDDIYNDYTLDGYKFTLRKNKHGNIISVRISVPEKEGKSAYQMFIVNSALPKEELEKVLLSMVK